MAGIHANGKLMRGFKDRNWLGIIWRSVFTADRCKLTALGFADFVAASNPANN